MFSWHHVVAALFNDVGIVIDVVVVFVVLIVAFVIVLVIKKLRKLEINEHEN